MYAVRVATGDPEDVKLPAFGRVRSLKILPEVNFKGLVIAGGKIALWASLDARHVATRLVVDAPLANVTATLCHIHGPGDDFWTKAMDKLSAEGCAADESDEETLDEPVPVGSRIGTDPVPLAGMERGMP